MSGTACSGRSTASADYPRRFESVLRRVRAGRKRIPVGWIRAKARTVLGCEPVDPAAGLRESVRWHLANPPVDASGDFTADDAALE